MKRRTFLLYSMGAAFSTLPIAGCFHRKPLQALSEPQVLMRLCDRQTIQEIGKAYRAKVSAESDRETLTDRLLETSSGSPVSNNMENSAVHAFLSQKIRQDFEAGRIMPLQGWMISETEARQCALFSLQTS